MSEQILLFLKEAIRLKRMLRSGWIYSGVSTADVESVADHSYLTSLLTLIIALNEKDRGRDVDIEKALIMSILHDLAECNTQDLDRRIRKFSTLKYDAFKKELDENAINLLLSNLPQNIADKLLSYYNEFSTQDSLEARIALEADRLEVILQLNDYIHRGFPKRIFSEFLMNLNQEQSKYQNELVRELAAKLLEEHDEKNKK